MGRALLTAACWNAATPLEMTITSAIRRRCGEERRSTASAEKFFGSGSPRFFRILSRFGLARRLDEFMHMRAFSQIQKTLMRPQQVEGKVRAVHD